MDLRQDHSGQKILFHLKEVNKVYRGYVTKEGREGGTRKIGQCFLSTL